MGEIKKTNSKISQELTNEQVDKDSIKLDTLDNKKEEIKVIETVEEKPKRKTTRKKRTEAEVIAEEKSVKKAKATTKTSRSRKVKEEKIEEVKEEAIEKIKEIDLNQVIGEAEIKLIPNEGKKDSSEYPINVVLKNLGYVKNVTVHYTEDKWNSVKVAELKFDSQKNDLEIWSTKLSLDKDSKDKFEFAIKYEVNNLTYWDNNFSNNYLY